ncbi:uncharacterized protein LOC134206871 [Armigeres subalbatus]|uniref:uncharacterized protein LOC134206871 n=1 Tax=Armigeres subalbatus TaxID=124917 RepID=UPI002ED46653
MGNSGSMHGLPGYDEGYHHPSYQHQYQRYHEMMRANGHHGAAPGWLESYQRDLRNGGTGLVGGGHRTFDNHRHNNHDGLGHRESTSSGPSLPPPMKVLPDIPGRVAKLRPTNNGNILHSGGTISKNNNLQRSKSISSPTYQQHQQQHDAFDESEESGVMALLPPRLAMQRSRTQMNMVTPGRRDFDESPSRAPGSRGYTTNQRKPSYDHGTLNKKRFGSEPDLRIAMGGNEGQDDSSGGSGGQAGNHRNTKPAQSKIIKGKNKKKAPVPPPLEKREREAEVIEKQRIIAYSPLRKTNSDASSTQPSSDSNSNNPTRKLRLFKTRAETKKNLNITKLPEASDAKYSAKNGHKMPLAPSNSSPYKLMGRKDPDFDSGTLDKPKSRLNPTSFFRREKTFDIGVLERDRVLRSGEDTAHVPEIKPTMSPPISRRKSIVKSLLEKDQAEQQQQQQQRKQKQMQQSRVSTVEPKFKPKAPDEKRKQSQPTPITPMTDFQKELQLATRRKSVAPQNNPNHAPQKSTSSTTNHRKLSEAKQTIKVEAPKNSLVISVEPSKQESPEREKPSLSPAPPPPPLPKTSFYFGMAETPKQSSKEESRMSPGLLVTAKMLETRVDSDPESSDEEPISRNGFQHEPDEEMDKTQLDAIDRFAASLMNGTKFASGSDSAASSDVDTRTNGGDLDSEAQEISLKLRPTLPRKHFEIPRFSPAAAWRLLTTEDDFGRDATEIFPFVEKKTMLRSLEAVEAAEERIERIYREPVPGLQDNKSGDSGISGDAGLPDIAEAQLMTSSKERDSPESSPADDGPVSDNNAWSSNALRLTPWTPQQDLEDDETTTGSSDNRQLIEETPISNGPNDFSSKGHIFSLSLPRESHLSVYTATANGEKVEKQMFNSLQKLRKSVSDAFTSDPDVSPLESGDNWFLSRLESPSITNAYEKRQLSPTAPKQSPPDVPANSGAKKEEIQFGAPAKHSAIGYLVSGKHMMYLPKDATKVVNTNASPANNDQNNNVPNTPAVTMSYAEKRRETKENMQDPVPEGESFPVKISTRKNHRFTFQSTIRQIEKRRVAEKLSREAEIKEALRLSELEAMRRVEEEFQKKRAREKASIRHQLRLFTMEETGQVYDANDDDENIDCGKRIEPEADNLPNPSKPNGMYRKKDSTLERPLLQNGGQTRRLSSSRFHGTAATLERKYSSGSGNGNYDRDLEDDFNNSDDNIGTNTNGHNNHVDDDDDDDDVDSSLGYIDTRTPYISRIIQAKSSKSYSGGLKK